MHRLYIRHHGRKHRPMVYTCSGSQLSISIVCMNKEMRSTLKPRRNCIFSILLLAIAATLLLHTIATYVGPKSSTYVAVGAPSNTRRLAVVAQNSSKCPTKVGYIMTLRYSGQQGSGIGALLSQLCWIGSFDLPMRLVEPYIVDATLVGLSPVNRTRDQFLRVGDFFDLDHLMYSVRDRGYGTVSRMEEFEREAPRDLVLIQMVAGKIADYVVDILWETRPESLECMTNISSKMGYFEHSGFCVVKVIKIIFGFGTTFVFTEDDMHSKIFGHWKPEDITLVFSLWREPWFVENVELVNPAMCKKASSHGLQSILYPSKRLLQDTRKYEDLFLQPENQLSVMMRVEHSVWMLGRTEERAARRNSASQIDIKQCFHKLRDTVRALQTSLNSDKLFLTADIGKYASTTWNQTFKHFGYTGNEVNRIFSLAKFIIGYLHSNKISFEEWENSFSKVLRGRESAGYVAALQRTIASRSDCLVLLGGGIFQRLALHDYMRNHPDLKTLCVYFVCLDDAFSNEFNEITGGKATTVSL